MGKRGRSKGFTWKIYLHTLSLWLTSKLKTVCSLFSPLLQIKIPDNFMFISIFVLNILTLFLFFVYKLKFVTLFKRIENFAQVYLKYYSESVDHFLGDASFHNEENLNQISFLLECSFDIFGVDHWKTFNILLWMAFETIVMKKTQKQIIIYRNGNIT